MNGGEPVAQVVTPVASQHVGDLDRAGPTGCGLITEKLSRMKACISAELCPREVASRLPALDDDCLVRQERVVVTQMTCAEDFPARCPHLAHGVDCSHRA